MICDYPQGLSCLFFDIMTNYKFIFSSGGKGKGHASEKGLGGHVYIPVWTKIWPRTSTEPPLCQSRATLHHAVNWRLYWEGLTT